MTKRASILNVKGGFHRKSSMVGGLIIPAADQSTLKQRVDEVNFNTQVEEFMLSKKTG
jgi:hypothetical protein